MKKQVTTQPFKKKISNIASLKQRLIHSIINHFINPDLLYVFRLHFKDIQINLLHACTALNLNDHVYEYRNLDKLTTESAQLLLNMLDYIENRMPSEEKEIRIQYAKANPDKNILLNYYVIEDKDKVDKRLSSISKPDVISVALTDNREAILVNDGSAEFHDFMLFKIVPANSLEEKF